MMTRLLKILTVAGTFGSLWLAIHMGWFAYITYLLGIAAFVIFALVRRGKKTAHKMLGVGFLLASAFVSAGRGRYPFLTYLLGIYTEMIVDLAFNPDGTERKTDKSRLVSTE